MKLVLASTWETSWKSLPTSDPEYLRFDVEDLDSDVNRKQYVDFNDGEGKTLVPEILRDEDEHVPVYVLVPIYCDEKWCIVSGYAIRKLHARFPEVANAMEVSLNLSCFLNGQTLDVASFKGRKIGGDYYMCTIGCFNPNNFQGVQEKRISKVHLKLVVDIPDKPDQLNVSPAARKVLEEGLFSDVTICAGSGGVEIKTHKCFLSACSPVLRRMFENEMKESKTGRVEMPDASERGINAFLRYLYYGDLEEPKQDIEIAFELLSSAHKYDVRSLESEMVKCLLETTNEKFTVKLAFKMYMFVRNIETAVELKMKTIRIMKAELDELESLQEYKDLFEKPSNSKTAMALCKDLVKTV